MESASKQISRQTSNSVTNDRDAESRTNPRGLLHPGQRWTSKLDAHLLHLRQVAQLQWRKVFKYFPDMPPGEVRRRFNMLVKVGTVSDATTTAQFDADWRPRRRERANPVTETPHTSKVAGAYRSQRGARANTGQCANCHPSRRRRLTRGVEPAGNARPLLLRTLEEGASQTTRSGRRIIPPLKYWAGEGYVWNHGEIQGIIWGESEE